MLESPLNPDEEVFWRSLLVLVATLPRLLDDDLSRSTGISLTEYATLMNLSEAENQELRLTDLANAIGLSLSRISRVAEDLRSRGLVSKRRAVSDTRGNIVTLTPAGLVRLQQAYPGHLESARRRVMDCVDPTWLVQSGKALSTIVANSNSVGEAEAIPASELRPGRR
ncbi:MarR family winged helix-turn-helix transcriptional regulator [Paractinoplanes toevensis]|uniref:MarR family transcriptional regulator n=1 Tax=Paractinoplanes toevensis TaxID=571911 RepID=A0A919W8B8_9ACTN|nr:MarR family transcriptional regulator [Actinoplanes toevensis]GIM93036.1 MarR family transcriptional regulator [Actinoplanes toevensis]